MNMKVLLDTNFMLIPFQEKVDVYEEIKFLVPKAELITLRSCVEELKKLKKKGALQLMKLKGVKVVKGRGRGTDEQILNYLEEEGAILATLDKELMRKVLKRGQHVITLRQSKKVVLL